MQKSKKIIFIAVVFLVTLASLVFAFIGPDESRNTEEKDTTMQTQINDQPKQDEAESATTESSLDNQADKTPMELNNQEANNISNYTIDMKFFEYSVQEIKAKPGENITINLTNSGGIHDFVIDELGVQSAVINGGESTQVTFTVPPEAAGNTYIFYCSIGNHRALGMEGNLIISGL